MDVGGLTPDEARGQLAGEFAGAEQPVELRAQVRIRSSRPAAAGLTVDLDGTVAAAGTRSANPFVRIGTWFGAGAESPLLTTVDAAALAAQLTALAGQVDSPRSRGRSRSTECAVDVVDPVTGRTLDVPASADAVAAVWAQDPRQLAGTRLVTTAQPVRASAAGTAAAAAEAQTLLAGPLTVQANGTTLTVPVDNLAAAVTVTPDTADGFTVALDTAAVRATYQAGVEATQTQPVDATVGIVGGAPVVNPAQDGLTVDWAATDAALDPALRADRVLTVVYTHSPAGVSTETVQAYGINEVIGEFSTAGFASDSGQNIKQVAEEVQGAIVLPGETFSLNGYTGKRGVEEGYVEAGIIQEGVASRAVGGGISQFATTLFNASYFAGMEDVEHQTHSYYISRYPPGREATVFENPDGSSVIDLQFKNSYPTAILIQTEWTPVRHHRADLGHQDRRGGVHRRRAVRLHRAAEQDDPVRADLQGVRWHRGFLDRRHQGDPRSGRHRAVPGDHHHLVQRADAGDLRAAAYAGRHRAATGPDRLSRPSDAGRIAVVGWVSVSCVTEPEILARVEGSLGHLTLNRPRALNALNAAMVTGIHQALQSWADDPDVLAVLIDGAGERGLCAGGDVKTLYFGLQAGSLEPYSFWSLEYAMNAAIASFPKPYVAFMDGICFGGGHRRLGARLGAHRHRTIPARDAGDGPRPVPRRRRPVLAGQDARRRRHLRGPARRPAQRRLTRSTVVWPTSAGRRPTCRGWSRSCGPGGCRMRVQRRRTARADDRSRGAGVDRRLLHRRHRRGDRRPARRPPGTCRGRHAGRDADDVADVAEGDPGGSRAGRRCWTAWRRYWHRTS